MDRISQSDAKYLMRCYEGTPHVGVPLSSVRFVDYIDNVVQDEATRTFFNGGPLIGRGNDDYHDWIHNECHQTGLEDEAGTSTHERAKFWTSEARQERRKRVLQWLVNRTIDYYRQTGYSFRDGASYQWTESNGESFRCNLRDWKKVPEFVERTNSGDSGNHKP